MGPRNEVYGDPLDNFQAIADLKTAFWGNFRSHPSIAHYTTMEQNTPWGHAIDMVFNNLGRIASAPTVEALIAEDRYKDGVNYLAIAFELSRRS